MLFQIYRGLVWHGEWEGKGSKTQTFLAGLVTDIPKPTRQGHRITV